MQLRNRGELHLLKEIRRRFSPAPDAPDSGVVIGIGDDAAVIDPKGKKVLVTTDMMNEGIHFDLAFSSPFHLGFKLVSVNVSDIMAMGGSARYLFLNISMKKDVDEAFFWELYEGIASAMELYRVELLGGDLTAALNDTVLSATVLGEGDRVITRGGASVGDRIYITQPTGDSACGLEILKSLTPQSREAVRRERFAATGEGDNGRRDLEMIVHSSATIVSWKRTKPLLARHLMPVARDPRPLLPYASAMIDVSDGLFIDLSRLCDESGVGARVYLDRVPLSDALRYAAEIMGLDPLVPATSGGEDYELLFTAPADSVPGAFCIGEVTGGERVVVDRDGREMPLRGEGYQHFGAA
ncbi:MAG: thiamine-phosphate kinase [Alphaproteobacteria bacterium]|uniref:Thiamine-monophosphate kinase n=1 Tax=Candidatus Nitrobium versatile TaxID=2884831 RepID=A0A953J515_9BACT|nr:thiamine-phosphate kinase [Candidatus Nitrobium versatile]